MHNLIKRSIAATLAVALAVTTVLATYPSQSVMAAGEPAFTGATTLIGTRGVPVAVNLQLTANDTSTVVPVQIAVTEGYLSITATSGITMSTNTTGRSLSFSGTITDANTALATLKYTATSSNNDTLSASLSGAGEVFFPDNGHIYEFVSVPDGIDWADARVAAENRTKNGAQGYLATITSLDENNYVASRLENAGWMGASDTAQEGEWEWATGPESGLNFWSGDYSGSSVDGEYEEWADGEPNNAGDEDCTQYLSGSSGEWNDLPCVGTTLPGYVVEYGADGDLPYQASKSISITNNGDLSPITITDCQQLQHMRFELNADYVLGNDVDCTETEDWNGDRGWIPAGDEDNPFTGDFNGNGHKITNLYMQDDNRDYNGLFGYLNDANIHSLTLENGWIRGANSTGGIAGHAYDSRLENVHFSGTAWARLSYWGGGLVGFGSTVTIVDSSTSGFVHGSGNVIGGLVGYMEDSTISGSHSSSDVDGGTNIGGAIGLMDSGTVTNSYATGSVDVNTDEDFKAGTNGGGFVGRMYSGTITKAYATGDVSAVTHTGGGFVGNHVGSGSISEAYATGNVDAIEGGGFAGEVADQSSITNAYAWGNVTGAGTIGGFVGIVYGNSASINKTYAIGHVDNVSESGGFAGTVTDAEVITNSFWDRNASGFDTGDIATAKTTAQLQTPATFTTVDTGLTQAWDGSAIWALRNGYYPVLKAFYTPGLDEDGDGINDSIEAAAPNSGDANNDGTPDNQQANVTSFVNPVTDQYAVLESPADCNITSLTQKAEGSLLAVDGGYDYPLGLMNFSASCGTPGYSGTFKQYYYGAPIDQFVLRKYNSIKNTYATINNVSITNASVAGLPVLVLGYDITDGSDLDQDGTENGTIVDPAGPATSVVRAPNTGIGRSER